MLTPMMSAIADMIPDNPGIWLLHCHMPVPDFDRLGVVKRSQLPFPVTRRDEEFGLAHSLSPAACPASQLDHVGGQTPPVPQRRGV
jgi:hypothetical protein